MDPSRTARLIRRLKARTWGVIDEENHRPDNNVDIRCSISTDDEYVTIHLPKAREVPAD